MFKSTQDAKKHAYDISAEHLRAFANGIEADARRANDQSEKYLAKAMRKIADSLESRGKAMRRPEHETGTTFSKDCRQQQFYSAPRLQESQRDRR